LEHRIKAPNGPGSGGLRDNPNPDRNFMSPTRDWTENFGPVPG